MHDSPMAGAPIEVVAATAGGLLERGDQLALLDDLLDVVRESSRGCVVLVAGEAGVGKTALIREFCDDSSACLLRGACEPLFTPRPLGPLLEIAHESPGDLADLLHRGAMPYEVVAALVEELRERTPAVFVLEDVHWADEATLDVLRLLVRRVETVPALVVATYRDDELDASHPLRIVLGELATSGAVTRVKLPALSPEAVAELAEPYGADADELFDKTAGNPFFVVEALAAGGESIPDTVRDAVLARSVRLCAASRGVLEAVAVVPPQAELWLLEALAGDSAAELDECLASGLLVSDTSAVTFRHELARQAVEESIAPHRKLELHRAALAALAEPPQGDPDLARLAHHAEAAGDRDAVLRFAPAAAAEAAIAGAHREAAAQYARALRFGSDLTPAERADLLEQRSRELYLTDDIGDAIEAVEEALELRRELGQPLDEGRSLCWLSDILWCPGRTTESAQASLDAVGLLETLPPSPELAWAYSRQGSVELMGRALDLAHEVGDEELVVRVLDASGNLTFAEGGREQLEQALELARRADLVELQGRALINLVGGGVTHRRYSVATEYVDTAIDYCSEHGLELYRYYALAYRSQLELALGRWSEAAETATAVLRIQRASILPRVFALVVLALVRARRGDPGYRALLEEAWTLAEPTRELFRMVPVAAARAEVAWLEGDVEGVEAATDDTLARAVRRGDAAAAGALAVWQRRAGIERDVSFAVAEPYAMQLSGDWAGAAAAWRELGCPYESALALAEGDDESALRRALDDLQGLEARPAAAIVAGRLRERGARSLPRGPRRATRENPAGLTARQVEVLALVVEGMRDSEIAARLVLSERTVGHHVSAILRKLAVSNRGQATAEAIRLGLVSQDR
jgi:DNA-binding CsgD family transcriptional regulator/tetratricopeptide (TPR) repeat protein